MDPARPASPPVAFTHIIEVADIDIDELDHASNIAYVRWIQDVAVAHSTAVGLDFEAYRKSGGVFVVRRHEIDYVRPSLRGDRLEVRTWIDSASAASSRRATELVRLRDGAEDAAAEAPVTVARAMTTWGYVDMATGRPIRIPVAVRTAFGMT